jgi:hypothetical protein
MILNFISGIYMTSFLASGFFFLKFYRNSGDRFFLGFAVPCWLLASERVALLFFEEPPTNPLECARSLVHLIRMMAFLIILFAIIDKNRKSRSSK